MYKYDVIVLLIQLLQREIEEEICYITENYANKEFTV